MKSWVGRGGGKVRQNVLCVGMSVRMSVMCYGSVQHNYSSTRGCFIKKLQELLEDEYEDLNHLIRWRNHLIC